MCGIVGIFTEETTINNTTRKDMFGEMLFADTFRGLDSTGVAVINHTGKRRKKVFKRALAAPDFLALRSYKKLISSAVPKIMIGHNRAATKGAVDDDTAHPFQYGNITLVHNGTLTFTHTLDEFTSAGFSVDSDWIAYAINKWGVEKAISQMQGSFSLVWYDSRDHSLNMLRNDQRPMHFAFLRDEETVMFGSEAGLIDWIAARNKEELDDNGKIYSTTPGYWIKFTDKCRKFTAKEVQLYKPPVYSYPHNNSNRLAVSDNNRAKDLEVLKRVDPNFFKGVVVHAEVVDYDNIKNNITLENPKYPNTTFKFYGDWKQAYDFRELLAGGAKYVYTIRVSSAYERKFANGGISYVVNVTHPNPTNILVDNYFKDDKGDTEKELEDIMQKTIAWIPSPNGNLLTSKEFMLIAKKGCRFCNEPIRVKDSDRIGWCKQDKVPICVDCTEQYPEYAEKPIKRTIN
ncbi:MAG: hypothetical protein KAS32_28550 [Candidatus Peribacteraceae bacterium]|nr:hypothetical protein [Candidatus Peribacteraceae bacterium]